eukprot:908398-Pelagomonas_calceolata.AAC.10
MLFNVCDALGQVSGVLICRAVYDGHAQAFVEGKHLWPNTVQIALDHARQEPVHSNGLVVALEASNLDCMEVAVLNTPIHAGLRPAKLMAVVVVVVVVVVVQGTQAFVLPQAWRLLQLHC